MKKKNNRKLNLYQKFALAMIALGLFPMLILSTFLINTMLESYRQSLQANYEQAAIHVSSSVENMLSVYDNALKMAYQYNFGAEALYEDYSNYDNLRKVLTGEIYGIQERKKQREKEMQQFLKNVENTDGYIYAAHFLADGKDTGPLSFHFSLRNTFFKDEQAFYDSVNYKDWDRTSKKLQLTAPHETTYYNGFYKTVFTAARNYYDLRGAVGKESYVGTLFLDVDLEKLKLIFKKMHLEGSEEFYLINSAGDCFFSTREEFIGRNLEEEGGLAQEAGKKLILTTDENSYGLKVIVAIDTGNAYGKINSMQVTMYVILAASGLALLLASIYFSRRLTRPIHNMMEQMRQVESGNFDMELPVESQDEIGILSDRFNRMSRELKNYINQSYVAQIKQNEAELTALKSQIYPHFLYNTLEIIRMTALENDDIRVSKMIEALSEQIHYLIGPMQDMVPLEKEADIVRKYVYLLNCRIEGKVLLNVDAPKSSRILVPKLILQPIVENAYVHGIKPKSGKGSVMIEARRQQERLEISVMDNGVGMDAAALERLKKLLTGDAPGIKNEYNWQSIGLKNVHDRIRYLYGEAYGIQVTSSVGVGTIVQVILPYQEMAENGREEGNYAENDSGG